MFHEVPRIRADGHDLVPALYDQIVGEVQRDVRDDTEPPVAPDHTGEHVRVAGSARLDQRAVGERLHRIDEVENGIVSAYEKASLKKIMSDYRDLFQPGALDVINRALRARQIIELVASADGCSVDHRHVGDPVDDALARLAEPLVTELTGGHPERIRICASDTCEWVFYDTSRTGRRRWCDMATCGNRAKAARHRARAKGAGQAVAPGLDSPPALELLP